MSIEKKLTVEELFADGTAIDRAMQKAVREAVERDRRAGHAIVVWQDGHIKWLQPHEIPVATDLTQADYSPT